VPNTRQGAQRRIKKTRVPCLNILTVDIIN
jgi:hypothetical protein